MAPLESLRGKTQPGRCAQAALDAEEGGRRANREEEEDKRKYERNFSFFFLPRDKTCSLMGGARDLDLTGKSALLGLRIRAQVPLQDATHLER